MAQHTHHSTPFSTKQHAIIVVCDGLQSPANIGAIFRLCDAFGVQEVIFSHAPDFSSNRLKRTARSTESKVAFSFSEHIPTTVQSFENNDYQTIALEISKNSTVIKQVPISEAKKIVLVIGNERTGVSEAVLNSVQHVAHIEMFGANSSMNVAQATAIALYELTKH